MLSVFTYSDYGSHQLFLSVVSSVKNSQQLSTCCVVTAVAIKIKMEKSFKRTNKKQMEKLVDLMTANPEIGRGRLPFGASKSQHKEKWEQFLIELNCLGPPIRIVKEWQGVWTHYKANLKRKLAANKKNVQATGGGPSTEVSLTSLEQSTVQLVSLECHINPSGTAMGLEIQEDSDAVVSSSDVGGPSTSSSNNKYC